jgi:hypothetical protein
METDHLRRDAANRTPEACAPHFLSHRTGTLKVMEVKLDNKTNSGLDGCGSRNRNRIFIFLADGVKLVCPIAKNVPMAFRYDLTGDLAQYDGSDLPLVRGRAKKLCRCAKFLCTGGVTRFAARSTGIDFFGAKRRITATATLARHLR